MRDVNDFRVSSKCSGGNCIGVADDGATVEIADLPDGETTLQVSRDAWAAFVAGVKAGEFDLDGAGPAE